MCSDHCPLMCLLVISNQGSSVIFISEAVIRSDSKWCLDWPSFCIERKKKALCLVLLLCAQHHRFFKQEMGQIRLSECADSGAHNPLSHCRYS